MKPQYEILANCLLPEHMLEWFDLTNVEVRPKEKKANQEQQSEEYSPNVIHLYLDEQKRGIHGSRKAVRGTGNTAGNARIKSVIAF